METEIFSCEDVSQSPGQPNRNFYDDPETYHTHASMSYRNFSIGACIPGIAFNNDQPTSRY